MQKIYSFLAILLISCFQVKQSNAQLVEIPDAQFRAYLINAGFSGCMTGSQLNTSCPAINNANKLNLTGYNVQDLTGLEYFGGIDTLIVNSSSLGIIPSFPQSLRYISIGEGIFNQIPQLPFLLDNLAIYNSDLSELPSIPNTVTKLYLSNNNLDSLPTLPVGLTRLDVSYNQLTFIELPPNLQYLSAENNDIDSISPFPNSLIEIKIWSNELVSIPAPGSNVNHLNVELNDIIELPDFSQATSLEYLNLSYNDLTDLPDLSECPLEELYISYNDLTEMPDLFEGLKIFKCASNEIDSIKTLPNGLLKLNISINPIQHPLPDLPYSLLEFECQNIGCNVLPELPPQLVKLNCKNNNLTNLPSIPYTLNSLTCSFNNLNNLPELPPVFNTLVLNDNPSLACLPPIEKLNGINYLGQDFNLLTNTSITCLPNFIYHSFSYAALDSLPLCGIYGNPEGCPVAWNVAGKVFNDAVENCIYNASESPLFNLKMKLIQGGIPMQQVYTNPSGFYSFDTPLDEHLLQVDTTNLPFEVVCPVNNQFITNPGGNDTLDFSANFALRCKPGFDLSSHVLVHVNGLFFPTNTAEMLFRGGDLAQYFGTTCNTDGLSGRIKIWLDGPGAFAEPQDGFTLNNDTLTIEVNDFSQFDIQTNRRFGIVTDTFPPQGSFMNVYAAIISDQPENDNNPSNDTLMQGYEVVNSYDPNYKEVYPSLISETGKYHTFTFHFQNTGTAAAQNIRVVDTLSSHLDWGSFELLGSSHEVYTQILENGIAVFHFPEIFLPDSTSDEPNSHGWAQFRIKTNENLPVPIQIPNSVAIYFDFNDPIITNDAIVTYCLPKSDLRLIQICQGDSIMIGENWVQDEGEYVQSLLTSFGCDSVVTTQVQFRQAIQSSGNVVLCADDSIQYNGVTYAENGVFVTTFTTPQGCDSIYTFEIIVLPPIVSSNTIDLCQGDTLFSNGTAYTEEASFETIFYSHGCDSTVTTSISILPFEVSISATNEELSTNSGMVNYQWIDCTSQTAIEGQQGLSFTPTISGTYAVVATAPNGCVGQSQCIEVTVVGIHKPSTTQWSIQPNPANNTFILNCNEPSSELVVFDLTGRLMFQSMIMSSQTAISVDQFSEGIYLVELRLTNGNSSVKKLIVAH